MHTKGGGVCKPRAGGKSAFLPTMAHLDMSINFGRKWLPKCANIGTKHTSRGTLLLEASPLTFTLHDCTVIITVVFRLSCNNFADSVKIVVFGVGHWKSLSYTHTLTIFLLVSRSKASGLDMMDALTYQSGASGERYFSSTSRGESFSNGGREEVEELG